VLGWVYSDRFEIGIPTVGSGGVSDVASVVEAGSGVSSHYVLFTVPGSLASGTVVKTGWASTSSGSGASLSSYTVPSTWAAGVHALPLPSTSGLSGSMYAVIEVQGRTFPSSSSVSMSATPFSGVSSAYSTGTTMSVSLAVASAQQPSYVTLTCGSDSYRLAKSGSSYSLAVTDAMPRHDACTLSGVVSLSDYASDHASVPQSFTLTHPSTLSVRQEVEEIASITPYVKVAAATPF
ncbi:hypothetical protein KIPB_015462, partial [Kipferlia bialata]